MRAAAILMVVTVHAPKTFPGEQIPSMLSVDLFFALSGFLIAQMMVERFDGISTWPALRAFMLNRWLRIFPLYYLTLAAFLVYAALRYPPSWTGGSFVAPWQFVFFLSDLTAGRPNDHGYFSFFLVSWSLSIEELFYFGCPLVALLTGRWRRSPIFWICLGAAVIVATILARLWVYLQVDDGSLTEDSAYRRATFLRADVFVYGAAIYWLCQRGFFTRRNALLVAAIGLVTLLWCAVHYIAAPDGFFSKIWLLSLVPMACAMLIPAAMMLPAPNVIGGLIRLLSTRTYALYLTHMLVPAVWFIFVAITPTNYLWSLAISFLLANLLHIALERPFMQLRPMDASHKVPALAE